MGDKSKNLNTRLPLEAAARLEARALAERRTVSQLCRIFILEGLEREPELDAILARAMKATHTSDPVSAVSALLELSGSHA